MSEAPTQAPRRSTRERQQTDFLRGNPHPTHSKRRATPVFTPTPTPPPTSEMSSTTTTRPAAEATTQPQASTSAAPTAPADASASTAGWRVVDPAVEELITAFPPDMFNPNSTTVTKPVNSLLKG